MKSLPIQCSPAPTVIAGMPAALLEHPSAINELVKLIPLILWVQILKDPLPLARPRLSRIDPQIRAYNYTSFNSSLIVSSVLHDQLQVVFSGKLHRLTHVVPILCGNRIDRHKSLLASRVPWCVDIASKTLPNCVLRSTNLVRAPERAVPVGFDIVAGSFVVVWVVAWPGCRARSHEASADGQVESGPCVSRWPALLVGCAILCCERPREGSSSNENWNEQHTSSYRCCSIKCTSSVLYIFPNKLKKIYGASHRSSIRLSGAKIGV
jgi:hypothetical protein